MGDGTVDKYVVGEERPGWVIRTPYGTTLSIYMYRTGTLQPAHLVFSFQEEAEDLAAALNLGYKWRVDEGGRL
jgi:hypothetical protein